MVANSKIKKGINKYCFHIMSIYSNKKSNIVGEKVTHVSPWKKKDKRIERQYG